MDKLLWLWPFQIHGLVLGRYGRPDYSRYWAIYCGEVSTLNDQQVAK